MKKILFILLINLMLVGVTIGGRMAQAGDPPDLSVSLSMQFDTGNGAYELSDLVLCDPAVLPPTFNNCIVPNITVENTGDTTIYISERLFNE